MKHFLFACILLCISSIVEGQVTNIKSNKNLHPYFALDSTKGLLISDTDSLLWVTKGTASTTLKLSSSIHFRSGGAMINGKYIFVGNNDTLGNELYITNGTAAGTKLVKDINTGSMGSNPDNFTELNGKVYFTCVTSAYGRELWRTDGTAANTQLVKDIVPGILGSNDVSGYQMFSNGSYLLFSALTAGKGYELWKSNGTPAGTSMLMNISLGDSSSRPGGFAKFGNMVLFFANTVLNGRELWKTDGTAVGTSLVKDIGPASFGSVSNFVPFFIFNNKAYFTANNISNGEEIWMTNGTTAGTTMMKDLNPGPAGSYSQIFNAVTIGSKFFFGAFNNTSGFEIWQSDGTGAGTSILKDIVSGSNSSFPIFLLAYKWDSFQNVLTHPLFNGNKFFFMAQTPTTGTELWVCDGTVTGTKIVKDIKAGMGDGLPNPSYIYTTSAFYFSANNGTNGNELWQTDGTTTGTSMVADINIGLPSADVNFGFAVNHKMVFQATNGDAASKDLYCLNALVTTLRPSMAKEGSLISQSDDLMVKIVGNPVRSQLGFNISGLKSQATATITDVSGRTFVRSSLSLMNGFNSLTVDKLHSGLYFIVIDNGNERKVTKFLKE